MSDPKTIRVRIAVDCEEKIVAAIKAGRAYVDKVQREFGYDSMEFAEARAAWHETITPLGAFEEEMRLLKLATYGEEQTVEGKVTE